MYSYVIKHTVEKEVHKLANFNFNGNSGDIKIETRQGADHNNKITSACMWVNRKSNKDTFNHQTQWKFLEPSCQPTH